MSKNDVTGDKLITKNTTDSYRDNWDAIWGKKEVKPEEQKEDKNEPSELQRAV